jgi:hypothetical protein
MALSRGESSIPVYRSKYSERESGRTTAGAGALDSGAEAGACVVGTDAEDDARLGGGERATFGGGDGALGPGLTRCSTRVRLVASSSDEHDAEPKSRAPMASPRKMVLPLVRFTWIFMERAIDTPDSARRVLQGGSNCSKGGGPTRAASGCSRRVR